MLVHSECHSRLKISHIPHLSQVDFKVDVHVIAIATQGRADVDQWVTKYIVVYSSDGNQWKTYEEDFETKVN